MMLIPKNKFAVLELFLHIYVFSNSHTTRRHLIYLLKVINTYVFGETMNVCSQTFISFRRNNLFITTPYIEIKQGMHLFNITIVSIPYSIKM